MRLLKKMRMEALYSQKEFAQVIGISQNHYSNIENGVRRPSPEVAKRIADVLGFGSEWYRLLEIGETANKKPASAG